MNIFQILRVDKNIEFEKYEIYLPNYCWCIRKKGSEFRIKTGYQMSLPNWYEKTEKNIVI